MSYRVSRNAYLTVDRHEPIPVGVGVGQRKIEMPNSVLLKVALDAWVQNALADVS